MNAQQLVRTLSASRIGILDVVVPPQTSYVFATANCTTDVDPVINVWDPVGGVRTHWNDDIAPGNVNASVTIANGTAASIVRRLYVHNVGGSAALVPQGRCGLTLNGQPYVAQFLAGGHVVDVRDGASWRHETTAAAPGAADRAVSTLLLGLDSSGRMVAVDTDGGVGEMSRLQHTGIRYLAVGVHPYGGPNPLVDVLHAFRLISNDYGADADGDGLGLQLETSLGTCDRRSQSAYCGDTWEVFNLKDTDRDGLEDGAEVFGVDAVLLSDVLDLPRWGATPVQKDLFVEIDYWYSSVAPPPVRQNPWLTAPEANIVTFATTVRDVYAAGTSSDLKNPNGLDGVRIHLDLGREPASLAHGGLWGDFGGSGGCDLVDNADTHGGFVNCMNPNRVGVFRYALATVGVGGQAPVGSSYFRWGSGSSFAVGNGAPIVFAHELGHSVGLRHFGEPWHRFGGGALNCKPNYASIMNYCYEGTLSRFSVGRFAGTSFNAARVVETTAFPRTTDGLDALGTDFLTSLLVNPNGVWRYIRSSSASYWRLNWNRDQVYQSVPVRAGLQWAPEKGDQALANEQVSQLLAAEVAGLDAANEAIRPALVSAFGDQLVAFYVNTAGQLRYRFGTTSGLVDGGCPHGDGMHPTGATQRCMTWSPARTLSIGTDVATQVSATFWEGRLWVAWRNTNGQIRVRSASGVSTSTGLTGLTTSTLLNTCGQTTPGCAMNHAFSLSVWNTDPAVHTTSSQLSLMYLRDGGFVFTMRRPSMGASWTLAAAMRETPSGAFVFGGLGVDAKPWPAAGLSPRHPNDGACAVIPTSQGQLRVFCVDPSHPELRWTPVWIGSNGAAERTCGAPALAIHPERLADGSPIFPESILNTSLWVAYVDCNFEIVRVRRSEALFRILNPRTAGIQFPIPHGYFLNRWGYVAPGGGVAYATDLHLGALKALWIRRIDPDQPAARLTFEPLADGTFDAEQCDGNDWHVIERVLCHGLHRVISNDHANQVCGTALTAEDVTIGPANATMCAQGTL